MSKYELIIINNGQVYSPPVIEPINFETQLKGSPSKLSFKVIKGAKLNFQEGNQVFLKEDGNEVFSGIVFTKSRDKKHHIEVTAYDQTRYFKNKDTLLFENMTATEIIKRVSILAGVKVGNLIDTRYKIKSLVCQNKSYFDMIQDALDLTIRQTGVYYIMYDKYGLLTLDNIENLEFEEIFDENNIENFDYKSTIDDKTYNQIKLLYTSDEKGKTQVFFKQDKDSIKKWGTLQYFEEIDDNSIGETKANILLKLHNKKNRTLSFDTYKYIDGVRAGYRVGLYLNVGDIILQNKLLIKGCSVEYRESSIKTNLEVVGGLLNVI